MKAHVSMAVACAALLGVRVSAADTPASWRAAEERGRIYGECGQFAHQLLQGWLETMQDPQTHLYSRGKTWDYHNEAADHYSSLVLIASYVDPARIAPGGPLHETLASMQRLCTTPAGLLLNYDLRTQASARAASFPELAEWLRDGLLRINEVLGTGTAWYRESLRLVDAMLAEAPRRGGLYRALENNEARGNLLQTLARLHVMSGSPAYLRAAEEIGDEVLLSNKPFTEDLLKFNDHGCELVPGLAELFAVERQLRRPRGKSYEAPLVAILDAIMASGAHPVTGLFTNPLPPGAPGRERPQPPDTWGYVLFAHENHDRATGQPRYRTQIEAPLRWLLAHRERYGEFANSLWPRTKSSDDWSDSYESMIVLWNRYPDVGDGFAWLDWATRQHIHRRAESPNYGPFTGGHFDGSVGRTLCMHMQLCSQGARAVPFTRGVELGAMRNGDEVMLTLKTEPGWRGRLIFDGPRTRYATGTLDWARLNEMPQWFVAQPAARYRVTIGSAASTDVSGSLLISGLPVEGKDRDATRIRLQKL